ncbi:MAG: TatD family hydrolase [Syntrophales bacterium]|nr:TatD family hydrolase [Syntrophales bacterium]
MLIDSHTHLELEDFDRDRGEVVERARRAGIEFMVTVGTTIDNCKKALSLASRYEALYVAVGIHPHGVKDIDNRTYDTLRELAGMDKVVAYGEIGLDFFRNLSPPQLQVKRFGEQLELACEIGLPVIIHDRDAHRETIEMLSARRGGMRGVVHCFSGDRVMAAKCVDMGFFISIPGTVTFEKAEELRKVVQYIPLSSLLVETDAPYLAPQPHRGKRNEPAYVVKTAERVAELKGLPYREVAYATSENAKDLFGLKGKEQEAYPAGTPDDPG